jgi:folate-binding protein YgfZ
MDEYRAVRERAGIVDRSERGKIVVSGNDRRLYLHALFTNDIASIGPGAGCYSAYLTPQGRMIADLRVLELGDVVLLDLAPEVKDAVLARLDQFIFSEDVRLADVTAQFAEFGVHGPEASRVVAAALAESPAGAEGGVPAERLAALRAFQNLRATFGGEAVIVTGSDELGEHGLDLYIDRSAAGRLHEALVVHGAADISRATAEVLRIEVGRPAFGRDMDAETIPLEAGIEGRAVSFTKGCYPGQEVIVRILHRGHGRVVRRLVGLAIEGLSVADPEDLLFAEDREAGRVTSAALSPARGSIALGYVHRDFAAPGTELTIAHGATRLRAVVVETPFVPVR